MQSLLHQVSLELLGRLPSAAADQPIHGHPKGREHSLSCRGSSWDTFRQQQWTAQLCTKTHPLAPQPFHSLRIHGPSRGQTPRRPRLWGLQTQVGETWPRAPDPSPPQQLAWGRSCSATWLSRAGETPAGRGGSDQRRSWPGPWSSRSASARAVRRREAAVAPAAEMPSRSAVRVAARSSSRSNPEAC